MMTKAEFDAAMKEMPLVAILRGLSVSEVDGVCGVLADAGITLLEVPLNTPNVAEVLKQVSRCLRPGQHFGAGTVLDLAGVQLTASLGGEFVISPNCDPEVIRGTKAAGMLSMPGCLTATECITAWKMGADYIKIYPAGRMGPEYIKDIKAVVPMPFVAVGAVGAKNLKDFLSVCVGAGIGSALYKPGKTLDQIRSDAQALVAAIR
ncbi:MAG: hypothetical protein IJJ26_00400 [Victivallales bacterium]|nr:hypothetical protein [Victivallales bacterium]